MARPRLALGQLGTLRVSQVPVTNGSPRFEATGWLRRMDGKKVLVQVRGTSISNARQRAYERAEEKKWEGSPVGSSGLSSRSTYGEVLRGYIRSARAEGRLAPQSIDRYETVSETHLIPALGNLLLNEITRNTLAIYARRLGNSAAIESRKVFRSAWRWSQDEGLTHLECPWRDIAITPKAQDQQTRELLSAGELNHLIALADTHSPFMAALVRTAADTGLRIGELLALSQADLDRDALTLTVRHTVIYVKGQGLVRAEPKTPNSIRTLKISPVTAKALTGGTKPETPHDKAPEEPIPLISLDGKFNYPTTVEKKFRQMIEGTGLEGSTFHTIRRTVGSVVARHTGLDESAAEILGHANTLVTGKHYYKRETLPRDATQAMNQFLKDNV